MNNIFRVFLVLALVFTAAMVAAGCGQYGKVYTGDDSASGDGSKKGKKDDKGSAVTSASFNAAEKEKSGCSDLEDANIIAGSKEAEKDGPPTMMATKSKAELLAYGIYYKEQDDERWARNLDIGQIVIAYDGISGDAEDKLVEHVGRAPENLVLLPRKDNPEKGVYYIAEGKRVYCEKPSAAALQMMINDHMKVGDEPEAKGESEKP